MESTCLPCYSNCTQKDHLQIDAVTYVRMCACECMDYNIYPVEDIYALCIVCVCTYRTHRNIDSDFNFNLANLEMIAKLKACHLARYSFCKHELLL